MTTALETRYVAPTRPYSGDELADKRTHLYRSLRLGKEKASHLTCKHFYVVKENGRKEKEILERRKNGVEDPEDCGNCSVCWKITKTPGGRLRDKAEDLFSLYFEAFARGDPERYTYNLYDLEKTFYGWLYQDTF